MYTYITVDQINEPLLNVVYLLLISREIVITNTLIYSSVSYFVNFLSA